MGMSSIKELKYLNFADTIKLEKAFIETPLTVYMTLSRKVNIKKRVVEDIFKMFGDVGGLWDFIAFGFAPIFMAFS